MCFLSGIVGICIAHNSAMLFGVSNGRSSSSPVCYSLIFPQGFPCMPSCKGTVKIEILCKRWCCILFRWQLINQGGDLHIYVQIWISSWLRFEGFNRYVNQSKCIEDFELKWRRTKIDNLNPVWLHTLVKQLWECWTVVAPWWQPPRAASYLPTVSWRCSLLKPAPPPPS